MKQIKLHLKYHVRYVLPMFLIYALLAMMWLYTNVTFVGKNAPFFEVYYMEHTSWKLGILFLVLLVMMLLLLMRLHKQSLERQYLLPQPKWVPFVGDCVMVLIAIALFVSMAIAIYALSFFHYIEVLDHKELLLFQQTRDIWISMSRCAIFADLMHGDIKAWIQWILTGLASVALVAYGSQRFMQIKGTWNRWEWLTMLCLIGAVLFWQSWLSIFCLILTLFALPNCMVGIELIGKGGSRYVRS